MHYLTASYTWTSYTTNAFNHQNLTQQMHKKLLQVHEFQKKKSWLTQSNNKLHNRPLGVTDKPVQLIRNPSLERSVVLHPSYTKNRTHPHCSSRSRSGIVHENRKGGDWKAYLEQDWWPCNLALPRRPGEEQRERKLRRRRCRAREAAAESPAGLCSL